MDNSKIIAEGFTCEELAEALMIKLKPFISESIREELAKTQKGILSELSNEKRRSNITTTEPEVSDNGRYSVTETKNLLGISFSSLLTYGKEGKIKFGIRKANGRKFYTGMEIKKFWKVQY